MGVEISLAHVLNFLILKIGFSTLYIRRHGVKSSKRLVFIATVGRTLVHMLSYSVERQTVWVRKRDRFEFHLFLYVCGWICLNDLTVTV